MDQEKHGCIFMKMNLYSSYNIIGRSDHVTLQESEEKLSELNAEISRLLKEREAVLKEWNIAFNTEENIICIDENVGDIHKLYLVNGESKMFMCHLDNYDMEGSIEDYYKRIDTSIAIQNIKNKRDDIPEYQRNLVYAKAIEVRESVQAEKNQCDQTQRKQAIPTTQNPCKPYLSRSLGWDLV